MSSVETTELKLKTTPTGGVDAAHSPYYRRLLSAGYKGELQGLIGGGSLYGTLGLAIGAIVSIPLFFTGVGAPAAFTLMGLMAGGGALLGAHTFGNIGSVAAISAESADLSEQRRYLLDRYNDLPEGPEGDREAAAIRQELIRRQEVASTPPPFFHWKTVAMCATVGAIAMLALFSPIAAPLLAETGIFASVHGAIAAASTAAGPVWAGALATGMGAALGALAGAVVGIDRYYFRKWFDATEGVVHSNNHNETDLMERSLQVSRLRAAAREDEVTKAQSLEKQQALVPAVTNADAAPQTTAPSTVAASTTATNVTPPQLSVADAPVAKPDNRISDATLQTRLSALQQTLNATI